MGGIVIAGVKSGVGKTTIATGIMAALTRAGHSVQPVSYTHLRAHET